MSCPAPISCVFAVRSLKTLVLKVESPGSSLSITGSWIEIQNSWVPPPCYWSETLRVGPGNQCFIKSSRGFLCLPKSENSLPRASIRCWLTYCIWGGPQTALCWKVSPGDSHVQPELWTTAVESWFLRFISHQHCGWRMALNRVRVYAKILVVLYALHMVFYCQVPPSEVDFLVVMIVQVLLIHCV